MARPKAKCSCLNPRSKRSGFGSLRVLPSGRHQARYTIPGTETTVKADTTFDTHQDAEAWLATVRADLVRGAWLPGGRTTYFGPYAESWLANRKVKGRPIKPRTRDHYRGLLDALILPTFKDISLRKISPAMVREWHEALTDKPTRNAHAYGLLRTILNTALAEDLINANPCRIRGAGQAKRVTKTEPASLAELEAIVKKIPERYKLMVLLAAWCAMRYGELIELRGRDVDTRRGVIAVRRAVTWVKREREDGTFGLEPIVGDPKSDAGKRDVDIPPHLLPAVRAHMKKYEVGSESLLFRAAGSPTAYMRPATLYKVYYPAREAAGRSDLRFHDLRHTGAVLAAQTGATLAELMARLGHSTPGAAMRYQHAAKGRGAEIAKALSKLAGQA